MKLFLFLFLLFVLSTLDVFSIGIYPSTLNYENVLEKQILVKELTIFNTKNTDVKYKIISDDSWFSFEPSEIVVSAKNSSAIKIKLKIPDKVPNDVYESRIYVNEVNTKKGIALRESAIVKAKIDVNNKEIVDGAVDKILVRDAHLNVPVIFIIGIQNLGNVASDFEILFKIDEGEFKKILNVDAYDKQDFELEWHAPKIGKYGADIYVYLGNKLLRNETVSFEVFEEEILDEVAKADKGYILKEIVPLVKKPEVAIFAFFSLLIVILCFLNFFRKQN